MVVMIDDVNKDVLIFFTAFVMKVIIQMKDRWEILLMYSGSTGAQT